MLEVFTSGFTQNAKDASSENSPHGYVGGIVVIAHVIGQGCGGTRNSTKGTIRHCAGRGGHSIDVLRDSNDLRYLSDCGACKINWVDNGRSESRKGMIAECGPGRFLIDCSSYEVLIVLRTVNSLIKVLLVVLRIGTQQMLRITPRSILTVLNPLLIIFIRSGYIIEHTRKGLIVHPSINKRLRSSHLYRRGIRLYKIGRTLLRHNARSLLTSSVFLRIKRKRSKLLRYH